jgi:hypothetical protein
VKKIKPNTVHTSRTMMFFELSKIMDFSIENDNYAESMKNNVFAKKSQDGIKKTSTYLSLLYSFDVKSAKFRAFKYFWTISDHNEKAIIAFLFALNNDYLLRESISVISNYSIGEKVLIESLMHNIEKYHPLRFTEKTLRSVAGNIASSWKQAGFISGKVKNIRSIPTISYKVVSFAMLMSYLDGNRGDFIIQDNYIKALCTNENKIRDFAIEASKRDFLHYQFAGNVTSISFENIKNKILIDAI